MLRDNDTSAKWGRFHVHAAKAKPTPINTRYVKQSDPPPREDYETAYEDDPKELYSKNTTCVKIAYQRAVVSVPVAVKPFSVAGPTSTLCCSDPVVTNVRCTGTKDRICYFTITQEICVEVPIHFGAEAQVGEPGVDCLETSLEECDDCVESDD